MTKHIVARVDEIPLGGRKVVEVAGRSIGVFHIKGSYYAIRNSCPHQGGPLCQGRLTGLLTASKPGDYVYTNQGEILRCPWHGWEFDAKTGQSWYNPAQVRVRSYKVSVETLSSELLPSEVRHRADPAPLDPNTDTHQKGPYVAETYPVTVEQAYVLIEV